jgi:adenylylsulfate kinase
MILKGSSNMVKGFTLWFTGLSGAGKSTNSFKVYMELKKRSLKVELLDGDIIRTNFSKGLGFTKQDRDINIRRIGFISYLLNKNDIISVVAAIAPYREIRRQNRALLENYIEVFCDCPLDILEKRDPKGLYVKARSGEIPNFTGISDPYESPENPEMHLRTSEETEEETSEKVISFLEAHEYIPPKSECILCEYSENDERALRQHLASLGFARKLADA